MEPPIPRHGNEASTREYKTPLSRLALSSESSIREGGLKMKEDSVRRVAETRTAGRFTYYFETDFFRKL